MPSGEGQVFPAPEPSLRRWGPGGARRKEHEVDDELVPAGTPDDVRACAAQPPRAPVTDPTLGVDVAAGGRGEPRHRLVTIGDSLSQGFQSGAVFNTDLSTAAIVAYELGWFDRFRYPRYPGFGGLPFNLELLARDLEEHYGNAVDVWELPQALLRGRQ